MWFDRWFRQASLLRWFGQVSLLFYLCAFVMVASLTLGGGGRIGYLSDAILQLLAIPLLFVCSLDDVRGFFDEANAESTAVLFSNCRDSARSADPVAAVALDGVAKQGPFRSCVCDIGARGFLDADQRITL